MYFEFRKSRCPRAKRVSGHWTLFGLGHEREVVWELSFVTLNDYGTLQPLRWWNDSKMGYPVFKSISAQETWNFEEKSNRDTKHSNCG